MRPGERRRIGQKRAGLQRFSKRLHSLGDQSVRKPHHQHPSDHQVLRSPREPKVPLLKPLGEASHRVFGPSDSLTSDRTHLSVTHHESRSTYLRSRCCSALPVENQLIERAIVLILLRRAN